MIGRATYTVAVTLAPVAISACEFTRPLDPHPDVAALQVLLVSGESEARMLVTYPHREQGDAAPEITARIEGPGWTAVFSSELAVEACDEYAEHRPVPTRCVGAALPEAIRPGGAYRLHGTAPLGGFTGEMSVPAVPLLVEPADSVRLPLPDSGPVEIPIRYRIGSDVGTLLAEALDIFLIRDDGTESETSADRLGFFPQRLEGAEADTVQVFRYRVRFALRLAGIGWHFSNFIEHTGTNPRPHPWPSFGIEGEGVYGYFDGVTRSRAASIQVR